MFSTEHSGVENGYFLRFGKAIARAFCTDKLMSPAPNFDQLLFLKSRVAESDSIQILGIISDLDIKSVL